MNRTVLHPDWNIATCCEVENLVFLSHHGGLIRDGQELLTIEEQTEETFRNLQATLEAVGLRLEDVVMLNVLLKNIKDFDRMHAVWAKWFPREFPVRTTLTSDFVDDHCLIQMYGVAYRQPQS